MPAVARTTPAAIVAAARRLVDRHGPEALSMQAVAAAVGIQAPSLYKRFADRAALLHAVTLDVADRMRRAVERAATTGDPVRDLRAVAEAQRAFARRSPHLYALLFATRDAATELAPDEYRAVVQLILDRLMQIGNPRDALEGARLLVAYVHGFLQMDNAGAFRLGGNVDDAFAFGIEHIIASLKKK